MRNFDKHQLCTQFLIHLPSKLAPVCLCVCYVCMCVYACWVATCDVWVSVLDSGQSKSAESPCGICWCWWTMRLICHASSSDLLCRGPLGPQPRSHCQEPRWPCPAAGFEGSWPALGQWRCAASAHHSSDLRPPPPVFRISAMFWWRWKLAKKKKNGLHSCFCGHVQTCGRSMMKL